MYKVWVHAYGEKTWATNSLEFETASEARDYGNNLLSRWLGAKSFEVLPNEFTGFLSEDVIEANKVGPVP